MDPYFDLTQVDDDTSERGSIIRERLEQLRAGICCTGDMLQLVSVDVLNAQQLRIVLRRGLKHHIRRMMAGVGWQVRALKRVRIGNLTLGNLDKGRWRYLGPEESLLQNNGDDRNSASSSFHGRNRTVRSRPSLHRRNSY